MTSTPLRHRADDDPHQLALMSQLLEGEDPDAYAVIPVGALVSQLLIAINETKRENGDVRPGRASARLIRNLNTLGWIRDTAHPREPT